MKSFFKKLAFVMAMAMVVSLAAPAAASAAVEGWEKTYLADQNKSGKVTVVELTEGEKKDFRFVGAPSNWRDYKRAWKIVDMATQEVADREDATVNSEGLVRVYTAGIYEVQFTADGEAVASALINVNPAAPVDPEPTTPVDPEPTTPVDPEPTTPVDPEPTTPVDPEPTTPVDPEPTTPVDPEPTTPVDPEPTTPVDPEPTTPVDPEPTTPIIPVVELAGHTQISDKQMSFQFTQAVDFKASDIQLFYLIRLVDGTDFELPWDFALDAGKGETVKLSVLESFEDGQRFRVKFDGGRFVDNFDVKIGAIDAVEIVGAKTEIFAEDLETGDDGEVLEFKYVLKSNGVDLTNYVKNNEEIDFDVRYELMYPVEGSELMEFVDFSDEGKLSFTKAGIEAIVRPIYVYGTENGEKEIAGDPVKVKSTQYEPWSLNDEIVDWCLVKVGTAKGKADWNKKSLAADESERGEYKIVLRFKDSRGIEYVTDKAGETKTSNPKYVLIDGADEISEHGYSFKFLSGDTDFMLVNAEDDEDAEEEAGQISVYKQGTGYYYIARYVEAEDEVKFDGYVHAAKVTVNEARYLDRIEVTESVTAFADALPGYMNLCNTEVAIKSFDQNGIEWHAKAKNRYTVTSTNDTVSAIIKNLGLENMGITIDDTNHKITINGNELYEAAEKKITSFKFVVTETGSKKSDTFTITLDAPKYDADSNILLDQVTSTVYDDYDKVDVVVENIDLLADDSTPGGANDFRVYQQYGTITLYKLSGGIRVGKYTEDVASGEKIEHNIHIVGADDVTADGKWVVPTTKYDATTNPTGVKPGERWVVVYAPDGSVVTNVEWNATGDALQFLLADEGEDGVMDYEDLGDYTVKVYTFRFSAKGKNYNPPISKTIKVSNSTQADVKFVDKRGVGKSTSDEIKQVVIDTLKFNLNGAEWKTTGDNIELTTDLISDVQYISRDGYVIIKTVTFKVPIDRKDNTLPWNKAVVEVNVSVEADVPAQDAE